MPVQPAMTVGDVASYLNVDRKTVYRLAQRGELPAFKVAGTWRFRRDDIERWIETRLQRATRETPPTNDGSTEASHGKPRKRRR